MNEHHHYHNSSGGFVQGIIFGALIGAGLAFLLGTKQGKEIADEIKEKGLSLIDDFDDILNDLTEDTGEQTPAFPVQQSQPKRAGETAHVADFQTTNNYSTVKIEEAKPSQETSPPIPTHIETLQAHGRHLFHGIPKRR